ncbi:hypothetical protein V8J38_16765 (plasmid) [Brevundimonas olei]|uniref:Uncharacterized protein n=1 Tax=Brevundimonas olei TaxID=657642 RepID=A0ABZ2IMJ7_9CAUL
MIVLDQGDVVVLTDRQWLAFLEARADGAADPAASFGCSVGEFSGEVAALLADETAFDDGDRDPFADYIVQEHDQLYAVAWADWMAFVTEMREGAEAQVRDFGDVVGTVSVAVDFLTPEIARNLAIALRAALGLESDVGAPSPIGKARAA